MKRLAERYRLMEIPEGMRRRYVGPDEQLVKTPAYCDPSPFVRREGNRILYAGYRH